MSLILNILWSNYFIIYHIYFDYICIFNVTYNRILNKIRKKPFDTRTYIITCSNARDSHLVCNIFTMCWIGCIHYEQIKWLRQTNFLHLVWHTTIFRLILYDFFLNDILLVILNRLFNFILKTIFYVIIELVTPSTFDIITNSKVFLYISLLLILWTLILIY